MKLVFAGIASVLLLLAPTIQAQGVVVVTNTTPGALQAAIDGAVDGDVLLIQPGQYSACVVTNKALTLQADPSGSATLDGLRVLDLAAGKRMLVKGLNITHTLDLATLGVEPFLVQDCLGSVRIQEVSAVMPSPNFRPALVLRNAFDVAISRSQLTGPSSIVALGGAYGTGSANVALGLIASRVALDHVVVTGGSGYQAFTVFNWPTPFFYAAMPGASACTLDATSVLFAHGSSFQGGNGGNGAHAGCDPAGTIFIPIHGTPGANSGSGLVVAAGASATELACAFAPGTPGLGGMSSWCGGLASAPGNPGLPISGASTSIVDAALELVAPTHVRAGQPIQLTVHGTAGDLVLLANSLQTRWVFDPLYEGVFLFGPAARRTILGTIPPSGTLTYSLATTALPPGTLAVNRYLQVVARHPSGQIELGGAAFVTLLDPSF